MILDFVLFFIGTVLAMIFIDLHFSSKRLDKWAQNLCNRYDIRVENGRTIFYEKK